MGEDAVVDEGEQRGERDESERGQLAGATARTARMSTSVIPCQG
jgi:hypothetical protein